jgi:uncharacterized membrane protein YhaH (DUF805 family)
MYIFSGRMGRRNFLIGILLVGVPVIMIGSLISIGIATRNPSGFALLDLLAAQTRVSMAVGIVLAVVWQPFIVRRLHDVHKHGWFSLIAFVGAFSPVVLLVFLVYLLVSRGDDGPNEYGSPEGERSLVSSLLNREKVAPPAV